MEPHHAAVALPLRMFVVLSHGYGCGGRCAVNYRARSEVLVDFGPQGHATVHDAGWHERSQASPEELSVTRRTWRFGWEGRWTGDERRRALQLEATTADCESTESGTHDAGSTPCTGAIARVGLECTWQALPDGARAPAADGSGALGSPSEAWICHAASEVPVDLGTALPWVLSPDGPVEERTVGEPRPSTTYRLLSQEPLGP